MTEVAGDKDRTKIRMLIDIGRYGEALRELSSLLARTPDDYWALCEKSICHLRLNQFQAAYDATKVAIAASPEDEWAYRIQSHVFASNDESGRALEAAEKAFAAAPAMAETTRTLLFAQIAYGALEEAGQTLELMLALAPDGADSHFAAGHLAFHRKKFTEAEGHFLETLRLEPDHVDALNNLGAVYLEMANAGKGEKYRAQSVEMFQRALRTEPTYKLAQANVKVADTRPARGKPWLVLGLFFFLISSPIQIFLYNMFTDQIDGQTSYYTLFSPLVGGPGIVTLNLIVLAVLLVAVALRIYYVRTEDKSRILLLFEKRAICWGAIALSLVMLTLYIPASIANYWELNAFPGIAARILFIMLIAGGARLASLAALDNTK